MDSCVFLWKEFKVTGQLIGLASVGVTTFKSLVMSKINTMGFPQERRSLRQTAV